MALSPLHELAFQVGGALDPLTDFLTDPTTPALWTYEAPPVERLDCGDSGPLGWLVFGGQEIGNEARTVAYLANRLTPANPDGIPGVSDRWRVTPSPCCPCPVLYTDSDGNAVAYERPDGSFTSGDPAPWYEPDVVESAEFLGLYITSIDGLDSVVSRSVVQRGSAPGGGYLGVERQDVRAITVRGILAATSCAGLEYGRRWLTHTLANDPCDTCDTYALEVRTVCPPGLTPPLSDVGLKTLYGVGLTEGPKRITPQSEAHGNCDMLEVEFTLTAADPSLYECPVECLPRTTPAPGPGYASGDDDPTHAEWTCTFDPPTPFGVTGLVLTLETLGPEGDTIDEIVIEGFTTAPDQSCEDARDQAGDDPCYRLTLADVPRSAKLVLDGARRRFTISTSSGGNPEEDALPYVVLTDGEPYEWPESTGCLPTCVVVRTVAAEADFLAVTIETRQRFLA